ncbi:MAG: hypothetical protein ACPG31_08640 [Planctomycetota bacterium]
MTPTRLFLLCILLLGAGGGLWWLAQSQGEAKPVMELPEVTEGALLHGDPAQLQRLTFEEPRYGRTIVIGQEDGEWNILEPLRDRPEPFVLTAALQVLYGTNWAASPEEWQGQSDADLGLDPPALLIEARYADDTTETLLVGAEEASGNWRVAKREEDLLRFTIPSYRKVARPLGQWRDHRLHSLGAGITGLSWEPVEGDRLSVKKTADGWNLSEPVKSPLEERSLPFLLSLLGARAEGIGEEPVPTIPEDRRKGTLTLRKGSEEIVLEIYRVGVVSEERDYLLSYDIPNFRFLEMDLEDLISRRILQVNPDRIASIRVVAGEQLADFRRSAEGWAVSGKDLEPKSSAFVEALLGHGQTLERGEEVALPEGEPDGMVIYSISRTASAKGSQGLRWWVDAEGRNLVSSLEGDRAYVSSINFALGVGSLFEEMPEALQ